jgi:uncharacterized LabA/DUF88 family protein
VSNNKVYKAKSSNYNSILPGDLKRSPDESFSNKNLRETLIFIDEAFLSKLSKHFGGGKYVRFDKILFAQDLARKENLSLFKLFYYLAPPFQGEPPTKNEELKKEGYDKFVKKLRDRGVIVREGRCQRLKINEKFIYHQKGVDVLLTMDLTSVPIKYPLIKKIILISSDSDFVPVIKNLREQDVKTILYTYYEKKRDSPFSRSNELIKSVYKYVRLKKQDLEENSLAKEEVQNEK